MSAFSPWEHDYIGLTEVSSMASTWTLTSHQPIPSSSSSSSSPLDIKETELRLGLPGSHFPGRKRHPAFDSVPAFGLDSGDEDILLGTSLNPTRKSASRAKRGFFVAVNECCGKGRGVSGGLKSQGCVSRAAIVKDIVVAFADRDEGSSVWEKTTKDCRPASKAQVVGRPPILSFRKNTTVSALVKDGKDVNGKSGVAGCPYVKVGMDGAPYLRKVDLGNYKTYAELLIALEQMFSCFTITSGSCACKEHPGGGIRLERQSLDLVSCLEYVLTYEDKEGDWMLVGDVPWRMFAESCRRMWIMKGKITKRSA